jgi:Uma2 family endonuclease
MRRHSPLKRMSLAAFLDWDDGTDQRYELVDGLPTPVIPNTLMRARLVARIGFAVDRRVSRPFWTATALGITIPRRDDVWYAADVVVTTEPRNDDRYVAEPRIIVEVLAASNADHALLQKLPDYRQIPSLEDLLYVSAEERLVRHWVRGQESRLPARVREGSLKLQAFDIELPLDEIYEGSGL